MKEKKFEYLIVGAGPAGMFACFELLKKVDGKKIALFDMGSRLEERKPSEVMTGFGGAGTYSDGKLHYTPKLSHERTFHLIDPDDYQKILNEVEKIFTDFGVDSEYFPKNEDEVEMLVAEAEKNDVELVVRRAQHVGTDKLKEVVAKFQKYLLDKGVTLFDRTEIKDLLIDKNVTTGVVDKKGNKYFGKKVLLVPGRVNATWLQNIGKKHGIKYQYDMVEIGVRVEFPR